MSDDRRQRRERSRRSTILHWLAVALIAGASACSSRSKPPFDFDHRIALVTSQHGRVCAGTDDAAFAAGARVQVIDLTDRRPWPATVKSPVVSCQVDAAASNNGRELQPESAAPPVPMFGIAIAASDITFDVSDVAISGDIDGDGRREFVRSCASYEGIHVTVWTDAPLTGLRRWHAYHYLGYDTEPSCTTAEVGER